MFAAALIDCGLPLARLRRELGKIAGLSFRLHTSRKHIHSVRALQLRVIYPPGEPERSWKAVRQLLGRSKLPKSVKETALKIFSRLAGAEAQIHGVRVDDVHFHEVGATDSIVDIVSAAIGVHELGIEEFHFSPIPLGRGVIRSRHGPLPAPGPATLALLKGLPVEGIEVDGETVTPTGAAIVSSIGSGFGAQPAMTIERIGYGAGQTDFASRPNLFRLVIGTASDDFRDQESMLVLETNIDDMNPELYDFVLERLFAAGARDVFLSPIQMKKNRPGTLLRLIAEPKDRNTLAQIIFRETSSIGVRFYPVGRIILERRSKTLRTRYGQIQVKVIREPGGARRVTPEYDDLKRIAAAKKIPLKLLYDEIIRTTRR
jgi:uncharacterized protein (TIGR00299 family) protein